MNDSPEVNVPVLRRRTRILILLNSAARAGLCPIGIIPLHAFAFLSNVLAPTWDMQPLDGKILKRRGGPFYPQLQGDLDRMVGLGMVTIRDVTHVEDEDGRWRLEGRYQLNNELAGPAIEYLLNDEEERYLSSYVEELAFALSTLGETDLGRALVEDATYSNPSVSDENVLDFSEWSSRNPSVDAANLFQTFTPDDLRISPGEKLHLYVRHLRRLVHAV